MHPVVLYRNNQSSGIGINAVICHYIKKSGDSSYRVGQRLIIKERDVSEYADIIETLGNHVLAFIYGHREERAK